MEIYRWVRAFIEDLGLELSNGPSQAFTEDVGPELSNGLCRAGMTQLKIVLGWADPCKPNRCLGTTHKTADQFCRVGGSWPMGHSLC